MSRIHLNRDRQTLGQFTPEEVAEGLRSGRFLPTDLAWREGMETWQPLSTLTDLPAPDEIEPVAPTLAPGTPLSEIEKAPVSPAWERGEGGLPARVFETIREVLGAPQAAFAGMPVTGGFARPLSFLLIVGTLCSVVAIIYRVVFQQMMPDKDLPEHITPAVMLGIYAGLAVFMPLFLTIGSFLSAGLMHLSLMVVGASSKPFEATYRVICYVNGATSVMMLLPFCGGIVQGIWNIYALTIGFREVHATTTSKALIAVLLPMAVCCGLAIAVVAMAMIPALGHAAK